MKPTPRTLLYFLLIICTLVCVFLLVLTVTSFWVGINVYQTTTYAVSQPGPMRTTLQNPTVTLTFGRGAVLLDLCETRSTNPNFLPLDSQYDWEIGPTPRYSSSPYFGSAAFGGGSGNMSIDHRTFWMPTLCLAVIPVLATVLLAALLRHMSRIPTPGICPKCRYDLRATPSSTCPECGTILPKPANSPPPQSAPTNPTP